MAKINDMAGHSKWKNIQHRKGAQDKKKAVLINKFAKEINNAAKNNSDPNTNSRLKKVILEAKSNGVSANVIEKALAKSSSPITGEDFIYECFFLDGLAVIIIGFSNNLTISLSDLKSIFKRYNGILSPCKHLFQHFGMLVTTAKENEILAISHLEDYEINEENNVILYYKPEYSTEIADQLIPELIIKQEEIYIPFIAIKSTIAEEILSAIEERVSGYLQVFHNCELN